MVMGVASLDGSPHPGAEPGDDLQGFARTVAIVDDDPIVRRLLRHGVEQLGLRAVEFVCGRDVLDAPSLDASIVCLDLGLGDVPGLDVLDHLKARDPDVSFIVVTAQRDVDTAVRAMRAGAYDYLLKPVDRERLEQALRRAMERAELRANVRRLETKLDERHVLGSIVGRSGPMRELARQVERVLDSDVTVCITGESGTGKELVASAIHGNGRRRRGPFVAINCAAIPESRQESERLGHQRGAFTGAASVHRGRFEQAHNGTLFLDEVGEMTLATQASLLRAIQERTIRRVGGTTEIPINVRIVCATHRDLAALVTSGRFRQDLYFRLMVYPIHLPPLRERTDDIPLLVGHFLEKFAPDVGREVRRVSANALDALLRYAWPGNVRELQNVIHRAMLSADGDQIEVANLPPEITAATTPSAARSRVTSGDGRGGAVGDGPIVPLRELERRAIVRALEETKGSIGRAAKLLGIGRATLYRRVDELQLHGVGRHSSTDDEA
jgi:DNA-binding NtrC family response regulator